jgi:hypothetical protein
MTRAYLAYGQATHKTQQPYELLNLGVLAYEAGDYAKAVEYLTRAEGFTHQRGSLFDKGMLHYYRGLARWAAGDDSTVRSEGESIHNHLPAQENGFLRWCEGEFASAGSAAADDSGQIVVICEAGLMPPLEGETGTVPLVNSDLQYANSDSGRLVLGKMLYDRWEGKAQPSEASVGYVKADLQRYRYPWERMTRAESVEARYDSTGVAPLDMAVNVGATKFEELANGNAQLLAMVPLRITENITPIYVEPPEEAIAFRGGEDQNVDRPQTKREGRREAPEPKQAKKSREEKKKEREKKEEKKTAESAAPNEDKDDDTNIVGAVFGILAVVLVVGIVYMVVKGHQSKRGDEYDAMPSQPSWEMLPVKIYTTTFRVAPGEHEVRAIVHDEKGVTLLWRDFETVHIKKGETVILRARCMD